MILGAIAPAQAATTPAASPVAATQSNNRVAPNSITTLPQCNNYKWARYKTSGDEHGVFVPVVLSTTNYNCFLATGSDNNGVWALQRTLNQCYQRGLSTDGVFGTATYNALKYAQGRAGATIDGVYGPETRDKILWGSNGGLCKLITYYYGF